jgi:hypothetical protein
LLLGTPGEIHFLLHFNFRSCQHSLEHGYIILLSASINMFIIVNCSMELGDSGKGKENERASVIL